MSEQITITVSSLFRNKERATSVLNIEDLNMKESDLNNMEDFKSVLLDALNYVPTLETLKSNVNTALEENELPSVSLSIDEQYALCGFYGVSVVTNSLKTDKRIVANIKGGHGVVIIDFDPNTKEIEKIRIPDFDDSKYLRECADKAQAEGYEKDDVVKSLLFIDGYVRDIDYYCLEEVKPVIRMRRGK